MSVRFKLPEHLVKFDFNNIIQNAEIFHNKFYEKPKVLLSLIKTLEDCRTVNIPVCTAANISGIQGQAKSRKTFFLSIATQIITLQKQRKLVIFDTEQAGYHSSLTLKRIFNLSPEIDVRFFNLRKYSQDVRLEFIEMYILNERPEIAFVDNIRDCLVNINSIDEATHVLNTFKQLLEETQVHVCMTLHENPGGDTNKARGHIGTELQNCAETIFKVEKDKNFPKYSIAKGIFTRNGDFDDLTFYIDENGIPILTNNFTKTQTNDIF